MSESIQNESSTAGPRQNTPPIPGVFATTHWSVVVNAGDSDTSRAQESLASLCRTYWHPLYAFIRRRGYSAPDAQDLTQSFFARLLEKNVIAGVIPGKGRFRSFLLTALKHFMRDEWDKQRAQKRGGGHVVTVDLDSAESRYLQQNPESLSPEKIYDRRWALTLLDEVHQQLQDSYESEGKADLFQALRFSLMGSRSSVPYRELAARLNMQEGSVKVAVHRLRKRYRQLLRKSIAETVATPDDVEEEMRHLLQALSDH